MRLSVQDLLLTRIEAESISGKGWREQHREELMVLSKHGATTRFQLTFLPTILI